MRTLTGHNGDVLEEIDYLPFGGVKRHTVHKDVGNFLYYTGRELDEHTGLYYYRARYYDPELGRFLSEDPLGFAAGVNFYAYVLNSPLMYSDPYGLETFQIGLSISGTFGGYYSRERGIAVSRNRQTGEIEIGWYEDVTLGTGSSPSFQGSLNLSLSDNESVGDIFGTSVHTAASLGMPAATPGPLGLAGISSGYSLPTDTDIKPSRNYAFDIGKSALMASTETGYTKTRGAKWDSFSSFINDAIDFVENIVDGTPDDNNKEGSGYSGGYDNGYGDPGAMSSFDLSFP